MQTSLKHSALWTLLVLTAVSASSLEAQALFRKKKEEKPVSSEAPAKDGLQTNCGSIKEKMTKTYPGPHYANPIATIHFNILRNQYENCIHRYMDQEKSYLKSTPVLHGEEKELQPDPVAPVTQSEQQ